MRPARGKSTQNTRGGYSEDTQIRAGDNRRVGARSPRPRLSLNVTGDRHHLKADLRSSRGQTCCNWRTICGRSESPTDVRMPVLGGSRGCLRESELLADPVGV